MLLAVASILMATSAFGLQAMAVVLDFNDTPTKQSAEPVLFEELEEFAARARRDIDGYPMIRQDELEIYNPNYYYQDWYPKKEKRSFAQDITFGEAENLEDAHMPEKRMYVYRDGFRPTKRSMAIGRAGMRPGKRAFTQVLRGKRGQLLPESFWPLNRFVFYDNL